VISSGIYSYSQVFVVDEDSATALSNTKLLNKLASYLKTLRGVRVEVFGASLGVELDWRRREPSISSVLEKLNSYAEDRNTHFLIVIDEAQELRFLKGVQLSYRFM
jgi:hypothetical protein